jgi:hypothetical protein
VATALNYQIDEYVITLTAAAEEIATLSAQSSTLTAGGTSSTQQGSTTTVDGYVIPADVTMATIIDDAFLEITRRNNNNGVPIMEQYRPQIHLYPGTQTFVYLDPVTADGGSPYYKVFDPDGQTIAEFYLRARDIQIKLFSGTPSPLDYPSDVVKARAVNNVVGYYVDSYDGNGKPVMEAINPRISYGAGDVILIHGARVIASGNTLFFAVYDPDGQPSVYLIGSKLEMLSLWD